jgi:DNA-binding LacI/PurR family transcriptional regulator
MGRKNLDSGKPTKIAQPTSSVKASRPKIQDVAIAAGVSLGTVSAVLNSKGRISDDTRSRVQQAIGKLGYRPDLYASNLARRSSQLLGVVVSNLQNPFFAETAQAIEEEAARCGFQISLMTTNFSPIQQRAVVAQLLGARIAGLAVITSEHDDEARQLIAASNVPAVFLDIGEASERSTIIRVDSQGGMQAAVTHLLDLGHRDLLYVRNSQKANGNPLLSHELRDQGFEAAIRSFKTGGLKSTLVDMPGPGADAGEAAIASVFGKVNFTAVIAVTDTVAMGVYRGLQARGIQIPRDVSVVGFDNTYFSRFLNPPLTTVDVPRTDLSRATLAALTGRETEKQLSLPTRLILRESTAPPHISLRRDPTPWVLE